MFRPEVSRSQALQQLERQIRALLESFGSAADYHFHVQRTGLDQSQFAEMNVQVRVYLGRDEADR